MEEYSFVLYPTGLPKTSSASSFVVISGLTSRNFSINFWFFDKPAVLKTQNKNNKPYIFIYCVSDFLLLANRRKSWTGESLKFRSIFSLYFLSDSRALHSLELNSTLFSRVLIVLPSRRWPLVTIHHHLKHHTTLSYLTTPEKPLAAISIFVIHKLLLLREGKDLLVGCFEKTSKDIAFSCYRPTYPTGLDSLCCRRKAGMQ